MADIIKDEVGKKAKTSLTSTRGKVESKRPTVTKTKVGQAIVKLRDVSGNGGYLTIAQEVGLTRADVAEIHQAMNDRLAELAASEVVE